MTKCDKANKLNFRAQLGAVQLTDDGYADWECDYRAAFHGDPGQLADVTASRAGPIALRTLPEWSGAGGRRAQLAWR